MIDDARLQALLRTERLGRTRDLLEETGSTNDDARGAACRGAPHGHLVTAETQRRGRGSHGRAWSSPDAGDLYFSVVLRLAIAPARLAPVSLAVGLGVAEAVAPRVPDALVQVKWPNDVVVGGRKCAGILVETSSQAGRVDAVIVGVGIDVGRRAFEPELEGQATSLALAGAVDLDREALLCDSLLGIETWVVRLAEAGPEVVAAGLRHRLALVGERVACGEVRGTLLGIAPTGALRVRCDDDPPDARARELVAGTLRRLG